MRPSPPDIGRHLPLALVVVTGVVCYAAVLSAPFVLDDYRNIINNGFVHWHDLSPRSWLGALIGSPSPRPIANWSFGLNHWLGGLDPFGYRVVNVAIHIVNGALVYVFAASLLGAYARRSDGSPARPDAVRAGAALAALVFVAHPIQALTITYIVQRMTALATTFYLIAFLLARRALASATPTARYRGLALAGVSWGLAMGSKQIAAVLPLALWLAHWAFERDFDRRWALRSAAAPAAALALLVGLSFAYLGANPFENYDSFDFGPLERLMTQARVLWIYAGLIVVPLPSQLSLVHQIPVSRSLLDPATTLAAVAALSVAIAASLLLGRRRPFAAFAVLWLLLHLAIESTVLPLEMAFEHRLYLPLVGIATWCGYLTTRGWEQRRVPTLALAATLVALLSSATIAYNQTWRDELTLWSDQVAKQPNSARAHSSLGTALARLGRMDEAETHFLASLRLDPQHSWAHFNHGLLQARRGDRPAAIESMRAALASRPDHVEARSSLGALLAQEQQVDAGIAEFSRVLEVAPYHTRARYGLAVALSGSGRLAAAQRQLEILLRWDPYHADGLYALGALHERGGRLEQARTYYERSQRSAPDFDAARAGAERVEARLAAQQTQVERAAALLRSNPDSASAHTQLASALAERGNRELALFHLQRALRLEPHYASAHSLMGAQLSAIDRPSEAVHHLWTALELDAADAVAARELSWLLATSHDPLLRVPGQALELASGARQKRPRDPLAHDALAAAQAANGQFKRAAATAMTGVRLAADAGDPALADLIRERSDRYRAGRPWIVAPR